MNKIKIIPFIIVCLSFTNHYALSYTNAHNTATDKDNFIINFTNTGHIISFQYDHVIFANSDHTISVAFQNTAGTSPACFENNSITKSKNKSDKLSTLTKVTYHNLWEGIDLSYEAPLLGIARSAYTVKPHANVNDIRLKYNHPIRICNNGSLRLLIKNGFASESAPVAWQIIKNNKIPVSVSFCKIDSYSVGFRLGHYDSDYTLYIDPTLTWNTFMGSATTDYASGIATDTSGNIFVTGYSDASWGGALTINSHTGGAIYDAFVAKLTPEGALIWNTFIGSAGQDYASGVTTDGSGNIFISGYSDTTWGIPVNPHSGGGKNDAFVAKLNSAGVLQWNTFIGSSDITDQAFAITTDTAGNVFVGGSHAGTSNTPAFTAKLNSAGALQWKTSIGGSLFREDVVRGIATDNSGNVLIAGFMHQHQYSYFGIPDEHAAFAAKLNSDGNLQWRTYMGSSYSYLFTDYGYAIATDATGNVFVAGKSNYSWGSPVNAHSFSSAYNAFVAKLDSAGTVLWNTFIGSASGKHHYAVGIAIDSLGHVFVTGKSEASWGSPDNSFSGSVFSDAFVAKLNPITGALTWNTFMGSYYDDEAAGIATDITGNVFVTGSGKATWGSPVNVHSGNGSYDAFTVFSMIGTGALRGDVNGDGILDLKDAIVVLIVLSGTDAQGMIRPYYAISGADVNGDNIIGLEEAVYILEKVSDG